MIMKPEEIIESIDELNEELGELDGGNDLYMCGLGYTYITNGYVDIVNFCEFTVYNSDLHTEEEIEEAGGLKEFIIQEKNNYIDMLLKVR